MSSPNGSTSDETYIEHYERVLSQEGRREGSQYVFFCPFPGCIDYDRRKFYVHPETGAWCCQHCNYAVPGKVYRETAKVQHGGTWRDFAALMGDDPNNWPKGRTSTADPSKSRLSFEEASLIWTKLIERSQLLPAHREMIRKRAIDPDQAGFVSADFVVWKNFVQELGAEKAIRSGLAYEATFGPQKGKLVATRCCKPGRILIPYWKVDQVRYFVGYQKMPPHWNETKDGAWPKIANITGYPPPLYGDVPEQGAYLIVTEGQLKAEAARQRGFPCVGLPGIGSGHLELANLCVKYQVRKVIILFDTEADPDTQEKVDYHAEGLALELLKRGLPVYRARFALEAGVAAGKKMDIDSFLLHHPTEDFVQVLIASAHERYVSDAR
jgi:hypothetical protein